MKRLIVSVLLLLMMMTGLVAEEEVDYIPLTREQAMNWVMANITKGENGRLWLHFSLLDFVIKYDYIEHTAPDVPTPDYTIVVVGDDVLLIPSNDKVNWTLGSEETGMLEYELDLPDYEFKDVLPKKSCNWLLPAGIGVAVGVLVTSVVVFLVK